MVGTWALRGIQCEKCHGPGSEHIAQGGDASLITLEFAYLGCHKNRDKDWALQKANESHE